MSAAERLRARLEPEDTLNVIPGAGHDDLPDRPESQDGLQTLLEQPSPSPAELPKRMKIH